MNPQSDFLAGYLVMCGDRTRRPEEPLNDEYEDDELLHPNKLLRLKMSVEITNRCPQHLFLGTWG